jgi:hypothetical protein
MPTCCFVISAAGSDGRIRHSCIFPLWTNRSNSRRTPAPTPLGMGELIRAARVTANAYREALMRSIIKATLLLSILLVGACSDSSGPGGESSITGTYILKTVNGSPLPFVLIQVGSDKLEIVSARLTLNSDMTFGDRSTIRLTEAGQVTTEEDMSVGTYTRTGNTVVLRFSDGAQQALVINGRALSGTIEGFSFVYER